MKLKTFFAWILGVFVVMLLVVQAAAVVTRLLLDDYRCAVAKHQELVSLSNELQQSSDELTDAVQSYVSTCDSKWVGIYDRVLAVRNGEEPRGWAEDSVAGASEGGGLHRDGAKCACAC